MAPRENLNPFKIAQTQFSRYALAFEGWSSDPGNRNKSCPESLDELRDFIDTSAGSAKDIER